MFLDKDGGKATGGRCFRSVADGAGNDCAVAVDADGEVSQMRVRAEPEALPSERGQSSKCLPHHPHQKIRRTGWLRSRSN